MIKKPSVTLKRKKKDEEQLKKMGFRYIER